jgi:hypothetical protein
MLCDLRDTVTEDDRWSAELLDRVDRRSRFTDSNAILRSMQRMFNACHRRTMVLSPQVFNNLLMVSFFRRTMYCTHSYSIRTKISISPSASSNRSETCMERGSIVEFRLLCPSTCTERVLYSDADSKRDRIRSGAYRAGESNTIGLVDRSVLHMHSSIVTV